MRKMKVSAASTIASEISLGVRWRGATRVRSDQTVIRITASAGKSFLDRMIALVEVLEREVPTLRFR